MIYNNSFHLWHNSHEVTILELWSISERKKRRMALSA
nr:MAG TPA: hypothetical protein [Caudoviricetes sp.]